MISWNCKNPATHPATQVLVLLSARASGDRKKHQRLLLSLWIIQAT